MKTKTTKSRTKTKSSTAKPRSRRRRKPKHYPAHVLALVLMLAMFVEGMAFGLTTSDEFNQSLQVLDMSGAVNQTVDDIQQIAEPAVTVIHGVDQFYKLSAQEFMVLFENNLPDNLLATSRGISWFYKDASRVLADMMDFSNELVPLKAYAGF